MLPIIDVATLMVMFPTFCGLWPALAAELGLRAGALWITVSN